MAYQKAVVRKGRDGRARIVYQSLGDSGYGSGTPCSSIPAGDPYRRPGNYCQTDDGVSTATFDGSGAVVLPAGYRGSSSGGGGGDGGFDVGGLIGKIAGGLFGGGRPAPAAPVQTGMSTTTKVALAGAAVVGLALILRSRHE